MQLGGAAGLSNPSNDTAQSPPSASSVALDTGLLKSALGARHTEPGSYNVERRQDPTSSTTASPPPTSPVSTVTLAVNSTTTAYSLNSTATANIPPTSTSTESMLVVVGPYSCTGSTTLNLLADVLSAQLRQTQKNLNASMKYLNLNLHAAAPASDPQGPADQPSDDVLPQGADVLNQVLAINLSAYLYTPKDLDSQRANLNASGTYGWFGVSREFQPDPYYFHLSAPSGMNSDYSTPNGWPSESFVEMANYKRLLVGFGRIDPQMARYNFSADETAVFGMGYLSNAPPVTFASDGRVVSGCYFNADETSLGASTNSSWSSNSLNTTYPTDPLLASAASLTACGISTILNQTLSNTTADQDYRPYKQFINGTMWAWGPGQPVSTSSDPDLDHHCAVLSSATGRLQNEDCGSQHYAACRVGGLPYQWQISGSQATYAYVDDNCADNASFSVPRTALESSYLASTWQAFRLTHMDDDGTMDELLWVDFNDLDSTSCWVIGQNTTCPYVQQGSPADQQIVVPVVAAVIVFVLALLTIFVKCAANRQSSRRKRRRGTGGWDYEGVPS